MKTIRIPAREMVTMDRKRYHNLKHNRIYKDEEGMIWRVLSMLEDKENREFVLKVD